MIKIAFVSLFTLVLLLAGCSSKPTAPSGYQPTHQQQIDAADRAQRELDRR